MGFWDWLKSFFAAFVGALVAVLLTPTVGPIFAGMIGGAIGGAIAGAFEGGLSGALHGAMWGAAIGGVMGAGYQVFGVGFLVAGAIGGAVYAGVTGGGEGLANYAAGAAGAFYGGSLGSALLNPSSVGSQTPESNLSPESKEAIKEALATGDFEQVKIAVENGNGKPSGASGNDKAAVIAEAARSGKFGKGAVGPGGYYDEYGVLRLTIGPNEPVNKIGIINHMLRTSHEWFSTYALNVQPKNTAAHCLWSGQTSHPVKVAFDIIESAVGPGITKKPGIEYYGRRLEILSGELRNAFRILVSH